MGLPLPADATEADRWQSIAQAGHWRFRPAGLLDGQVAVDKSVVDARAKAAAEAGTTPSTLAPWNVHDLRRTVATCQQRLGIRLDCLTYSDLLQSDFLARRCKPRIVRVSGTQS